MSLLLLCSVSIVAVLQSLQALGSAQGAPQQRLLRGHKETEELPGG